MFRFPSPKACSICGKEKCVCCTFCHGRALATAANWKDGMCGCQIGRCLNVVDGDSTPWITALKSFRMYFNEKKGPCPTCSAFFLKSQ